MVQRPGSAQEVHLDALMAQVWLGQWLLSTNCPKQLIQARAMLQGVRQTHDNVCSVDGYWVVVNHGVALLQMFIKVHHEDHQGVLGGQECHQVVLLAETLEHLLLALVNPMGVVLQSLIQLSPGCTADAGQQNLVPWRPCKRHRQRP